MAKKSYSEKLKDPRWQKKRLEILTMDEWACCLCKRGDKTLHVHHTKYEKGKEPWDYDSSFLVTLCKKCHETIHNKDFSLGDKYHSLFMDSVFNRMMIAGADNINNKFHESVYTLSFTVNNLIDFEYYDQRGDGNG